MSEEGGGTNLARVKIKHKEGDNAVTGKKIQAS